MVLLIRGSPTTRPVVDSSAVTVSYRSRWMGLSQNDRIHDTDEGVCISAALLSMTSEYATAQPASRYVAYLQGGSVERIAINGGNSIDLVGCIVTLAESRICYSSLLSALNTLGDCYSNRSPHATDGDPGKLI